MCKREAADTFLSSSATPVSTSQKSLVVFFVVVVVAGDTANTADQKYHCSS